MISAMQPRSSNNGGNGNTELFVAIAALAVSLFAFLCALLQALNQYYAAATGSTLCKTEVMGEWGSFTHRFWRIKQFRIEVQYRVPVIFVAPPKNKRGPLGRKPIYYIDGTEKSCQETHTWTVEEFDRRQDERRDASDTREAIRTADSELMSWAALLMAAQRMERESDEWQRRIFATYQPPVPPAPEDRSERPHTMAIGLQEQTRSWDTMHSSIQKPYATSAICHLIEIMAMLGVYWKEFDISSGKFRAQGNGFYLAGTVIDGLGLAFTFNKTGKTWFQEHRIVPEDRVKQLCFGFCPTIFRGGLKTALYTDEPKDERTLQLASHAEVAETLESLGCNTNTVNYFRLHNEHTRHSHLFPIPFEMLGMVGELLQIKHTAFTMLPNPTFFTWNKSTFSLIRMLQEFIKATRDSVATGKEAASSTLIPRILTAAEKVLQVAEEDERCKQEQNKQRIIRQRREEATKLFKERFGCKDDGPTIGQDDPSDEAGFVVWLRLQIAKPFRWMAAKFLSMISRGEKTKALGKRDLAPNVEERPSFKPFLETLHDAIEDCDHVLSHNYSLVQQVFVLHLQEVLAYLNEPLDVPGSHTAEGTHGCVSPAEAPAARLQPQTPADPQPRRLSTTANAATDTAEDMTTPEGYVALSVIDTASWADRHQYIMQLYCRYIRNRVRKTPMPGNLQTCTEVQGCRCLSRDGAHHSLMFADHCNPKTRVAAAVGTSAMDQTRGSSSQDTVAVSNDSIELNRWLSTGSGAGQSTMLASAVRSRSSHRAIPTEASARTTSRQATASPTPEAVGEPGGPEAGFSTMKRPTTSQDVDDIWCTLTFRMICWLMLHDFHRKDVQVGSKSDMYDSRMPVYLL